MFSLRIKIGAFALAALNSIATCYYFLYLYFHMQREFGFGSRENLLLGALSGGIYIGGSIYGGRLGQRRGCFTALLAGFGIMLASLLGAAFASSWTGHVMAMAFCTLGASFTWPALEAIVCEGANRAETQRMVGIYNLDWALANALGYFTGGAMIEALGWRSIFFVPAVLVVVQILLTLQLQQLARRASQPLSKSPAEAEHEAESCQRINTPHPACGHPLPSSDEGRRRGEGCVSAPLPELNPRPIAKARTFLRLALLANPIAYVSMSTILPVIPTLAQRLELSPKFAGFFCSLWMFARAAAFLGLWLWPGWHYRFRWLLAAGLGMVGGYLVILTASSLPALLVAQLVFGAAMGLIYSSSLFYAMDVGDTKAEHGGLHEAMIGAGNCLGPLVSAGALALVPQQPHSGAWAVAGLLAVAVAAQGVIYRQSRVTAKPPAANLETGA
jgi:MFS family permease